MGDPWNVLFSALALLFSCYALWRTEKFRKFEKEQIETRKELDLLLLNQQKQIIVKSKSADIGARIFSQAKDDKKLELFNNGMATARQVNIEFPEGNHILIESEIRTKFPLETMEPGQSVQLIVANSLNVLERKLLIRISWKDEAREENTKDIRVTY